MIKFRCREISQQDLALSRRFPADVLWYVANGKIYRIGRLSTELSELCFVGRYYDGNNGAIFASCCGLNLFLVGKGEPEDSSQSPTKKTLPGYPTTTFLYSSHDRSEFPCLRQHIVARAQQ